MLKHWNFRSVQAVLLLTVITVFTGALSLQAGESKLLKKDELKSLVANAKTVQDHERLAAHFKAKADELDAEGKEHTELAVTYREHPMGQDQKTGAHCDDMATALHNAALDARQLSADHAAMAKQVK